MTDIRQTINALIPSRPDRKLVAENKRLREALKMCRTIARDRPYVRDAFRTYLQTIENIANEALKEPD